jgi:enoyl-CoA hydratase/carnithine racemase
MGYDYLKFDLEDGIATVALNRPEKRNALSLELLQELNAVFASISQNNDVRVVIIRGEGKVFCAGHDISQLANCENTFCRATFDACMEVMDEIQGLPQPVIAQVHGVATAAGCQLVAACDLAVAEEGALFATPGVKIGFFCTTPGVPLVRAIGRKRALEMLFTGRMISAQEAEQYGLINKVVSADQLSTETVSLAQKIAEASPWVLSIGKAAFYNQVNLADSQAYEYAKEVMVTNLFAQDAREGFSAFLEKRKPSWKGR